MNDRPAAKTQRYAEGDGTSVTEFGDSYTDGSHCDYMRMAAWRSIVSPGADYYLQPSTSDRTACLISSASGASGAKPTVWVERIRPRVER